MQILECKSEIKILEMQILLEEEKGKNARLQQQLLEANQEQTT